MLSWRVHMKSEITDPIAYVIKQAESRAKMVVRSPAVRERIQPAIPMPPIKT